MKSDCHQGDQGSLRFSNLKQRSPLISSPYLLRPIPQLPSSVQERQAVPISLYLVTVPCCTAGGRRFPPNNVIRVSSIGRRLTTYWDWASQTPVCIQKFTCRRNSS